MIKSTRTQT